MKEFIEKISSGRHLTREESADALSRIMEGTQSEAHIAGLLIALKVKGEHPDELRGFAEVMRKNARPVRVEDPDAIDMCGTGGDGTSSFNISTVASFVVAGTGVTVAKHGNRSVSSSCGSADLLTALGARVDLPPEQVEAMINSIGIGFLFAPVFHPAMKHAARVRSELGVRTIFNMLGPLTNPAGVRRQIVGAFSPRAARMIAEVFAALGATRVAVVHSESGFDEVMLDGRTVVHEVRDGQLESTYDIAHDNFGLPSRGREACNSGSLDENVRIANDVLSGNRSPRRDVVVANAALGLYVAAKASTLEEGVAMAQESIDSGRARNKLAQFIERSAA